MSPAVSLALLSVNVLALTSAVYFAVQAGAIAIVIRTGSDRGVPVSKRNRLLMLFGNWLAPVVTQIGLDLTMLLFNVAILRHSASDEISVLASVSIFFWSLAALGTVGFGLNEAFAMRAQLRAEDRPAASAGRD